MKHVHRKLIGLLTGLALMGLSGGQVVPAAAAGSTTVYVDDLPGNNDTAHCPAATYTTVDSALTAIEGATSKTNVKLFICPGSYTLAAPHTLTGFTKLSIIGLGGPVINVGAGFTGVALDIVNSNKVTVSGLGFRGGGLLGAAFSAAIRFSDTNGTIKKNVVSGWHQAYTGAPPFVETAEFNSIVVLASTPQAVTIQQNSIYDSGDNGIWVRDPGKVNITKNRVIFTSNITPSFTFPTGHYFQAGIALLWSGPGSKITGNQVDTATDLYAGASPIPFSFGIQVHATSDTQVKSNTVRGTKYSIAVLSYCDTAGFPNANGNQITGNKLYDAVISGVVIVGANSGGACTTPHADGNQVKKNKIYSSRLGTPIAIDVIQAGTGVIASTVIQGNTIGGYLPLTAIHSGGAPIGTVKSGNKILPLPPGGPLNVPPLDWNPAAGLVGTGGSTP